MHTVVLTFLAAAAVGISLVVVACQNTQVKPRALTSLSPQAKAAPGQLEVRHTGGASYSVTRMDLVGTRLHFDITATIGSKERTRSFALQLGGTSNAWDETREAVKTAITGVSAERFTLWTSLDADQWWDSPLATDFMRSISTGKLETIQ